MKKPFLFNLPIPNRLKNSIFFRFYFPVKRKWLHLFDRVKLKFAPSITLKLRSSDFMHGLIAFIGIYEKNLTNRIVKKAKKGGLLIDVGANAGYFSFIWASQNPKNKVIAFEPNPDTNKIIKDNIIKNNLSDRITLHSKGLSNKEESVEFDLGSTEITGWGGITLKKNNNSIKIITDRLDNLINQDTTIDVMKVDVEGADTWAIMGAERLLLKKKIKTIFFEQNKTRLKLLGIGESELIEYLDSLEYDSYPLSDTSKKIVEWMAVPKKI